ncbi:MAG: MBL fold metallo-hydrolase [Acidobacteriia bacterium]|nr:MBL fold metallo-hydrolase [Terriglobia bacterium]
MGNLEVRFWGVRGSVPTPHEPNMEHGGNTPCIEVRLGGGTPLIFDAGTGIRCLGRKLLDGVPPGGNHKAHLFLTHFHWDHIQGLPFFDPLYRADYFIHVWSSLEVDLLQSTLERQMSRPYFPIDLTEPPRRPDYTVAPAEGAEVEGIRVEPFPLHHPGGSTGYRLSAGGARIVYATDHEPGNEECDRRLLQMADGADLLIIDSQYLPEEYPSRRGWGHGTWLASTEMAKRAGVKQLVLFHHDPARDDEAVEDLLRMARGEFTNTMAAREGWSGQL